MKKHLVNVWFKTDCGNYSFIGFVPEHLNSDGRAVFFPSALFKTAFGFELPANSKITSF